MGQVLAWAGRVTGVALVGLMVALGVGEGMPNPFTQPPRIMAGFLMLGVYIVGVGIGLWRQLLGGAVLLAGWAGFWVIAVGPRVSDHLVFPALMALPGVLYLGAAAVRRPRA